VPLVLQVLPDFVVMLELQVKMVLLVILARPVLLVNQAAQAPSAPLA